jgi:hypothetical protein
MPSHHIMLIRHAEKAAGPNEHAVDGHGRTDARSLSVRGWQRAGALVRLFAPLDGHFRDGRLAKPTAIFAAGTRPDKDSTRPFDTVAPLARSLALRVNDPCAADDDVGALAATIEQVHGPVLVCWRHETLPMLAGHWASGRVVPEQWPPDRHDLVWVIDRVEHGWRFAQVAQLVLDGDASLPPA